MVVPIRPGCAAGEAEDTLPGAEGPPPDAFPWLVQSSLSLCWQYAEMVGHQ